LFGSIVVEKHTYGTLVNAATRDSNVTDQERNATKNPDHEKKKVRPYLLIGLRTGIERALWLMRLTSGASQRCEALKPIFEARLRISNISEGVM